MPNTTLTRQLSGLLDRAKKQGWVVNAAARGRYKLSHPKAKKTLLTPVDTKQADALRDLEREMKAALGPVQPMQTTKAERVSRAAMKAMGDEELRARLKATQSRMAAQEQELATFKQAMEQVEAELARFRLFREAFRGMLQGAPEKQQPLRPQAAPRAPAQAAKKAGPARKAAAGRQAASTKKAAATSSGRKKAAPPAKRGRKAEAKDSGAPLDKTPLEQAIDDKMLEATPAADAGMEAATLATAAGEAVTQENAGRLIRAHRAARRESQVKAAPLLAASVTTLINWETGHTKPQQSSLPKIAEYLQTPPAQDHSSSLGT